MSYFEKVKVDPMWSDQSGPPGPRGERGLAGRDGVDGESIQGEPGLGFNYLGPWSKKIAYERNDVCFTAGSSYVCLRNHSNRRPPSKKFWGILAQGGADGQDGQTLVGRGRRGKDGKDGTSATQTISLVCDSDVVAGMALYASSDGHVDLAMADEPRYRVIGLANASATAGSTVDVVTDGILTLPDWTPVIDGPALYVGSQYYLSAVDPGKVTKTAHNCTGFFVQPVFRSLNLTTVEIEIGLPVLL